MPRACGNSRIIRVGYLAQAGLVLQIKELYVFTFIGADVGMSCFDVDKTLFIFEHLNIKEPGSNSAC